MVQCWQDAGVVLVLVVVLVLDRGQLRRAVLKDGWIRSPSTRIRFSNRHLLTTPTEDDDEYEDD